MSRRAQHLERPRRAGHGLDEHASVCGAHVPASELVAHPAEATCKTCVRRARGSAYRLLLLSHAAEALSTPWQAPPATVVVRGTSELDAASRGILARSHRGDDAGKRGPRWGSPKAAVQRWAAHVDEGATVLNSSVYKYTADGSHAARGGSREGRVSNVERSVDDVVNVDRVLARMYPAGMSWGYISLPPALCREVYVWRHAGRPVHSSTRRECVRRHDVTTDDLVELVCKRVCGCGFRDSVCARITRRHVALVVRQGNVELTAALVKSGELAEPRAKAV